MTRTVGRAAVLAALGLAACTAAPPVRLVSSSRTQAWPLARVEWIRSWEAAMATAMAAIEQELRLPRFEVVLHLFSGPDAFEGALLASGYDADFARATAGTMTAIGGHRRVLVNERNLAAAGWDRRLALLAHELAHSLQYELGGGVRGNSDQWLREGFAEWLSVRVLERLQAATLERARHDARLGLRGHARHAPPFEEMVTFPQWVALGRGPAADIAYHHAFAAVDFLIRRHGVPRTLRYFELFARSGDRASNFRAAFGEDLAAFERAFREDVWPAKRSAAPDQGTFD